tara:strand:- start:1204 stop:1446 length:243 start_codon:yes stop_codon:yes gene_type:complete
MAYENRKYVIINTSETGSIDFSQVNETSVDTLRFNLSGSQTFVKFDGETPSFLDGKTQYSHSEILTILTGSAWSDNEIPD